MAEVPKLLKEAAEPLKKGALVIGAFAFLAGSVGIVAVSALGYFAGEKLKGVSK